MLSIIISTRRPAGVNELKENIEATAGIPFEFVLVENHGEKGLCEAYNEGAEKVAFDFLCFVHDDVLFHSKNWGSKLVSYLSDPDCGVVGIMGGRYKSAFGLGWRDGKTDFYRMNVISRTSGGRHLLMNPKNELTSEVLCLDGAFLCCRKDVWERFRFDDKTFTGFHFYDIDFTFRVGQHFKNYVSYEISIEHFSSGNFNREYVLDGLKFEKKQAALLPHSLEKISKKEVSHLEGYALTEKLLLMKKTGFSLKQRMKLLKAYIKRHRNFYQLTRNLYFGFISS